MSGASCRMCSLPRHRVPCAGCTGFARRHHSNSNFSAPPLVPADPASGNGSRIVCCRHRDLAILALRDRSTVAGVGRPRDPGAFVATGESSRNTGPETCHTRGKPFCPTPYSGSACPKSADRSRYIARTSAGADRTCARRAILRSWWRRAPARMLGIHKGGW